MAGRKQAALRQITGFFLNGQLLAGVFIWLLTKRLRSVGDFFASTVILHDPDGILSYPPAVALLGSTSFLCLHAGAETV